MKLPEWVDIVKTNVAKELAPFDEDWYYTRLASLARHIYIRSPVGVSTVCKIYGGEFFSTLIFFYDCRNFSEGPIKPFFYPILRLEKVALNGNKNGDNTLVDSNVLVTFFLLLMLFHPTYNLIN